MKIFIFDKSIEDINKLKEIINNNQLGKLVGYSQIADEGIEDVVLLQPDLVILDMINENPDAFYIIKEIKKQLNNIRFISISNHKSKEDIEKLYKLDIEYFIYKPINEVETMHIINKVSYIIDLEEKLYKIKQIFKELHPKEDHGNQNKDCENNINSILMKLGILGEIGSEDIKKIVEFLIRNKINLNDMSLREICSKFSDNPKVMEQRMRRTIAIAMSNIASIGIEDYMNETFIEYSNTLFNFEQIKLEMDNIRGKSSYGGSINMKKFLSTMCIICQIPNN